MLSNFHIDVTFEMRTAVQSNVFIQLITTHKIQSSFISEMEKGERGKIAERQKESKHWLAADIALVIKWTIRKYTFLIKKKDGQHLERLLLISKMINLANDVSHNQSVLTAKIFGATTTQQFLT